MWFYSSFKIEIKVNNKKECFCQQLWKMILVNYLKCVFVSFSSLVKGSAQFPCNKLRKRYIHVEWLLFQLFSTVSFFSALKLLFLMKVIYSVLVPASIFKCKLVCLFPNYKLVEMVISLCIPLFIGMFPLPGFSTFDLEEKLRDLRIELEMMEGK